MGEGKLLEVFYDYNCSWCYLGSANTDRLRRERDIAFRWTLFPPHPEVPVDGMDLAELFREEYILDLRGKTMSVVLMKEGRAGSERLFTTLLGKR